MRRLLAGSLLALTLGVLLPGVCSETAQAQPALEFFDLSLSPLDPELESCDPQAPWNQIEAGQVAILGVREENSLLFSVRTLNPDGDPCRLEVVAAPDFVTHTVVDETLLNFDITPPLGTVTQSVCEDFAALTLRVAEYGIAAPETTVVEVPIYVKWEGPDLGVSLLNLPGSARLEESVRFNGRVSCREYASGPVSVETWLTDPDGIRVAGRTADYQALVVGANTTIPQILHVVDKPGEWCAYIELVSGRDVNPANNSAEYCFLVEAGALKVSPNVATPNGDGHNDEIWFHFGNQTIQRPMVRIFELNGNKLWETDRLDGERRLRWDGRDFHNHLMPPGTYLYVIYDDGREFAKGTCGVIR